MGLTLEYLEETADVYDLTVEGTHNFFANEILVHNCSEVLLSTEPMAFDGLSTEQDHDYDSKQNGEIALCILSNINFGKLPNIGRLDLLTSLLVRFLDNLIDYQHYPLNAAKYATERSRYLGIGISDYAHFLAKNEARVGSKKAINLTFKWTERFQYGLTKASIQLAKERGPAKHLSESLYGEGMLPIDTYNKGVHDVIEPHFLCDWESLRKDLQTFGIRNLALSAVPPAASSAIVSNSTQGIDPITDAIEVYEANNFTVKNLIPDSHKLKYYMKAWELDNDDYLNLIAVMQIFIDQSLSTNQWYDLNKYVGKQLKAKDVKINILKAWKRGVKTLYYLRTNDKIDTTETSGCDGGACSI